MSQFARCSAFLAFAILCAASPAQDGGKKKSPRRFGFDADDLTFSQQTPKEAMKSIAVALERKRVDYLLAQLADPAYVDYWVDRYKSDFPQAKEDAKRLLAFDRLARETEAYFANDPLIAKDLRAFAKQAEWKEDEGIATGTVETIPARKVFLKKIDGRWFLKNEQQ